MRVLLTSTGLETEEITEYFKKMIGKDMSQVNALFIPTAATDAGAIAVLPKCMNDLLKCGILDKNIKVFDLHGGMELEELYGKNVTYVIPELKKRIEDALLADDRVTAVTDFFFTQKKGSVSAEFMVHTIFGEVTAERTVDI